MVQRNRPVTSEYRLSFNENKHKCSSKAYERCYNYRADRRMLEHAHNVDVFTWNYTDVESNGDIDTDCGTTQRPASVPAHKVKHELFNKAYEKKISKPEVQVKDSQVVVSLPGKSATNGQADEQEIERIGSLKLNLPSPDTERDADKKDTPSDSKKKVKKVTPRKDAEKQLTAHEASSSRPPFILYGSHDVEEKTGQKKTHNIRASCEIYPSALRASRRHHMEAEMKRKAASDQKNKKRALYNDFVEKMKRETQAWGTEYGRHYIEYDADTYKRILSARFHPVRQPDLKGVYPSTT